MLRADHVAGAAFVGVGLLVIALSGDLPIGDLSLPGSGFMPKILAGFTILFGVVLLGQAAESRRFAAIDWGDGKHAAMVVAITVAAVALFERLGFLITTVLLMFALLVVIERRRMLAAAIYSLGVALLTYVTFQYVLKTPLIAGPFGF